MQLLPRLSLAFSGKHGLITVIEQSDNVVFISMQPNTGWAMVYEEHKGRIAFKLAYAGGGGIIDPCGNYKTAFYWQ